MENLVEQLAVTILLALLKDQKRAKKMLPALRKIYDALGLFFSPGVVQPSAMEPKLGA